MPLLSARRKKHYNKVFLLTTHQQTTAHTLYNKRAGFHKTQEEYLHMWGHDLYEERYELEL
jgi:hypothetical protein